MSTVRMCDRCGAIFSERSDNWQTFVATNVKRNKLTGKMETITEQLDACPQCATGPMTEAPAPRLATATDGENKQLAAASETTQERKSRLDAAKQLGDIKAGKR